MSPSEIEDEITNMEEKAKTVPDVKSRRGYDLQARMGRFLQNKLKGFDRPELGRDGRAIDLDLETEHAIIETTVQPSGKSQQIGRLITDPWINPQNKLVILYGPEYTNTSAVKALEDQGAVVVHDEITLLRVLQELGDWP